MSVSPSVSVIVPTYNRVHLLPRALDSVLAQTFEGFEALIVDDGSTDGTAELVKDYAERDPRVRYLRQPQNAGVSAARNRGLRESRGEFIAFLDSDDEWFPEKLARQVQRFRELPDRVGLLYGGVENLGPDGGREVYTPTHRGDLYRTLLERNVIHGTSGVMLRRTAAERAGFFDEGIPAIEDHDYWLRVVRHFDVDFIPEPLIRYHDPVGVERKSLNASENLEARDWLYRSHGAEMRRARTAHLYLLESARRQRASGDKGQAIWRAVLSILQTPGAYPAYPFLLETVLPSGVFQLLRRIRRLGRAERPPPHTP